jgi:hypothetical protein
MDNFDLTKFLAEGKLYEAMSPQDVVDIADTVAEEFTKESADEGDFLIYTVGKMEGEGFELDTDVSAQTPDSIDTRGVGEGWGGIFRIKPTADGYEVRNAEKGGLVAIIDNMGNFRMLSADESRAEMGRTKGEETDYMERRRETDDYMQEGEDEVKEIKSNKMKKSELKEMIKSAFLNEKETFDQAFDRIDKSKEVYQGSDKDSVKEAEEDEEVDVETEETADFEVEDTETVDVETTSEISPEVKATQDALTSAIEAAKALGDEKLADQIGNSITFFTRTHVVGQDKVAETVDIFAERILKNAGIKK